MTVSRVYTDRMSVLVVYVLKPELNCVCHDFRDANVRSAMDSNSQCTSFSSHGKFMNNHDHLPSSTDSEGFLSRLKEQLPCMLGNSVY